MVRPATANSVADDVGQLVAPLERHAHHLGDGLAGDVVLGGAEAAAHDDGIGAVERLAERRDDAVVVVADLRLAQVLDAAEGELLADPRRVRVDDLPEQQLGADGDHLTAHRAGCPSPAAGTW